MEETNLKIKVFDQISEKDFEPLLANTLIQSSAFIDQILIDFSKNEKEETVKNMMNLKSFMENTINDYKTKLKLISLLEDKKKEKEKLKELENQKDRSEQDL